MAREHKIPGPDHPITVEPAGDHIAVRSGETVIADSRGALLLREADYPAVPYIPADDVNWSVLKPSETTTYCPYKGEATYASLSTDSGEIADVLWKYDEPYPEVDEIRGHVAFYPDKVEIHSAG